MPKKRDGGETKKSRKASSASKEAATTSPSGSNDIVPPPNPVATHLVASNPFDDPPLQNQMKMSPMHGYSGPQMVRLQAPNNTMNPGFPGWVGRSEIRGMRPPYNGPGWNPHIHGGPGGIPTHPGYHPNMPVGHNGYNINRPHYPGHSPQFRGSSRMPMGPVRPGMGPLGSPGAPEMGDMQNVGPNHMVSSGNQGHMLQNTGQMKALTRPPSQIPSPTTTSTRKNSASSAKNSDSKSPKSSEPSAKSRKKSEKKSQEKKAAEERSNIEHIPPHSIPPILPQTCCICFADIQPSDDVIRCLASCSKWFHRTCVGLTESACSYLRSEELALWACDNCLKTKEIHSVRTRLDNHLTSSA